MGQEGSCCLYTVNLLKSDFYIIFMVRVCREVVVPFQYVLTIINIHIVTRQCKFSHISSFYQLLIVMWEVLLSVCESVCVCFILILNLENVLVFYKSNLALFVNTKYFVCLTSLIHTHKYIQLFDKKFISQLAVISVFFLNRFKSSIVLFWEVFSTNTKIKLTDLVLVQSIQ